MNNYITAIKLLSPNAVVAGVGSTLDTLVFQENPDNLTYEQIQEKVAELQAAEPLRLLRLERDKLLTASDWRMTKDYPYADQLDWEDYRLELRELPQRIENGEVPAPILDENSMLVFDEWPLKPGETA